MRVLLVPPKNNYPSPEPQTSFGLGQGIPYLAGALKAAGHEVFGANFYHIWCHGSAPLAMERVLRESIDKYQPQLIGVGGLSSSAHYLFVQDVIFFCRKIAPDIPIVIGGGMITYDADFIFSKFKPDFAIKGEGEISIVKLVEYLETGEGLESVPNLIYTKNGEVVLNKEQYPENLDVLAFPDYDPFDYEAYLSLYNQRDNYFFLSRLRPRMHPVIVGRSCPFRCTFCAQEMDYRTRSIDNAIKEIAYFYEKYQFNIVYLSDDLFSADKVSEFCAKVKDMKKSLKADFDWSCHLRVSDINKERIDEMKDAGCRYIGYGFESASNTILKSMKKGVKVEKIINAIQLTEQAGMGVQASFIFGDVAETPETIKETIDFHNKYCRNFAVYFGYITPYPGSALFKYCIEKSLIANSQEFYDNVINNKVVNMTSMPDDVFFNLTKPIMAEQQNCEIAEVLSLEKTDYESCDRNGPFETRRPFFHIKAICPHCLRNVEYVYPLGLDDLKSACTMVYHYCTKCDKKLLLDISKKFVDRQTDPDPYARFYEQHPYTQYYPYEIKTNELLVTPFLFESYKGFNIVRYGGYIHGISQALGAIDIPHLEKERIEEFRSRGNWFTGKSIEEIRSLIDLLLQMRKSVRKRNKVRVGFRYLLRLQFL